LLKELVPQIQDINAGETKVELIVINNASTDTTREVIEGYRKLSGNDFTAITNERNIGGEANFIRCVEASRGQYVWLFGDDEQILPCGVRRVVQLLSDETIALLLTRDDRSPYAEDEPEWFTGYGDLVRYYETRKPQFMLEHTLITGNIFKRAAFNVPFARKCVSTNYAHMLGFIGCIGQAGIVRKCRDPIIKIRSERAPFADPPKLLPLKQMAYLLYLAKHYSSFRVALFAVTHGCSTTARNAMRGGARWLVPSRYRKKIRDAMRAISEYL
jgi:glycosyltransferase involved in cell wall biosynthesis